MARLFGASWSRRDLETRLGDMSQVAGTRFLQLEEGWERGVRVADVRSGGGLRFFVSLDRGMDISHAEFKGVPLSWRSTAGDAHPSFFDPRGAGWTRTFPGGLLTGCGLSTAGAPSVDMDEDLGLHGRLSMLPASSVSASADWKDDECLFRVSGTVREWTLFREHLVLRRVVETALGSAALRVRDSVRNEGSAPAPLMMLYHINAGWPLVSEDSRLWLRAARTEPRDEVAAPGLATARTFPRPTAGYREQVFFHDLTPGPDGLATVLLANPAIGLGLAVRYRQRELPHLTQWKMTGEGAYVLGIEPGNCRVTGRAGERKAGRLVLLQPGEETDFLLDISVVEGADRLENFRRDSALE